LERRLDRKKVTKAVAIAAVTLLAMGGGLYYLLKEEESPRDIYAPTVEAPADFMVLVEYPATVEDMLAISCLTPLLFLGDNYHPIMVLDQENSLSRQELYTLSNWKTDRAKMLFGNGEGTLKRINSQLGDAGLAPVEDGMSFPLTTDICASFVGFDGAMTVSDYEESLWSAT